MITPEQKARDLLERLEHPRAQELTAGEVAELADLLARQPDPPVRIERALVITADEIVRLAELIRRADSKPIMRRYLLFAGQSFYPGGGFMDFIASFDSAQTAQERGLRDWPPDAEGNTEWWHVIDSENWQCVAKQDGVYNSRDILEIGSIKPAG